MNPVPMIPSIGRIVHYVMPDGQHRPAIIVRVWHHPSEAATPESLVNVQVLTDGSNDDPQRDPNAPLVLWRTSIAQQAEGTTPNTWHAPEVGPPVPACVPDSFVSVPKADLELMQEEALRICGKIRIHSDCPALSEALDLIAGLHQKLQSLVNVQVPWRTSVAQQPEMAPPVPARVPDSFVSVPRTRLDGMRGAALTLCYQIEALPAGPAATQASVMASSLHQDLQILVRGE